MARNRKRAKERRVRQTQPVASGRGRERVLDDGQERGPRGEALSDLGAVQFPSGQPGDGAPDPIEHAAPGAELAEARLATANRLETVDEPASDEELAEADAEQAELESRGSVRAPRTPVPTSQSAVAAPRPWLGARLVGFLEGSWRELQRVQWPDRRQVMQATGVVVGFVIVASVFLGVADLVASKVVHFILNGHF